MFSVMVLQMVLLRKSIHLLVIFFIFAAGGACSNQHQPTGGRIGVAVVRGLLNWRDLYVVSANEMATTQESLPKGIGDRPEWSPDGQWIVFSKSGTGAENESQLYLLSLKSGFPIQITNSSRGAFDPTWSPDGTKIAYYARDSLTGIYILDVACVVSGGTCDLAPSFLIQADASPDWSPDGKRIVYEKGGDILSIDSLGVGAPTKLTSGMTICLTPKWSPNGLMVAFSCYMPDHHDIFVASDDGAKLINLTNGDGSNTRPSWSPDGKQIAFISTRDGLGGIIGWEDTVRSNAIFLVDADGGNAKRLTTRDDEHILWYAWLP